jgi:hypothetical protein
VGGEEGEGKGLCYVCTSATAVSSMTGRRSLVNTPSQSTSTNPPTASSTARGTGAWASNMGGGNNIVIDSQKKSVNN